MDKQYGFLLVDGARNTILLPADELHRDIDTIIRDHISEVRPHPNL